MAPFRPFSLAALAVLIAGVAVSCGSSGGSGAKPSDAGHDARVDGAADDAADSASAGDDGGGSLTDTSFPFSSPDAPQHAADGCAFLNVTCKTDTACCSGHCSMGVCTTTVHP